MSNDTQNIIRHWREAVPNDRLAHLIRDASRAFHRALQVRLAQHGVPFGHWTFLRILWECDGLTQKELSERAGVMEPTTFTAMKAMESLGYIERRQIPTNKKNMYVHLSDKGRALKKLLVPLAEETNNVSIEGIAPEHIKLTRTVLLAMIENLARDELQQEKATPARRKAAAASVGAKHAAKAKAEKSATPDRQKPGRPSATK
ncbi:MarR family winged helix-turn-helix transcriptional regulator [Polaromonas sp. YR568]|uniref:MarR family winged helix-turn-helix transcriptional regulator n=1 Tax=Polaromonas sp. YR568 TaxID=1855301 RepID=UPI00398BFFB8